MMMMLSLQIEFHLSFYMDYLASLAGMVPLFSVHQVHRRKFHNSLMAHVYMCTHHVYCAGSHFNDGDAVCYPWPEAYKEEIEGTFAAMCVVLIQ